MSARDGVPKRGKCEMRSGNVAVRITVSNESTEQNRADKRKAAEALREMANVLDVMAGEPEQLGQVRQDGR